MKTYLSLFFLVFAFSLQAQIHTSGGANSGGDDSEMDNVFKNGKWAHQFEMMQKFNKHVSERNIICKGSPRFTERRNFLDTYINLSVYKTASIKSDDKCSKRSEYFKCLEDKEYKKQMFAILKDDEFIPFLERRYSISHKEAAMIVDFFKKIDE